MAKYNANVAGAASPWQARTAVAKSDDPREFVFDNQKYNIAMDDSGAPFGVMYFGSAKPTTLSLERMESICKPDFVAVATTAASKVVHAVKTGRMERKANAKGRMSWQVV